MILEADTAFMTGEKDGSMGLGSHGFVAELTEAGAVWLGSRWRVIGLNLSPAPIQLVIFIILMLVQGLPGVRVYGSENKVSIAAL